MKNIRSIVVVMLNVFCHIDTPKAEKSSHLHKFRFFTAFRMTLNLTVAAFLIMSSLTLTAQLNLASTSDVEQFYKTKTLVVKDGKPFSFFNPTLEEAVKKHWRITPYDFIEAHMFEKNRQNDKFSFLIFTEASFTERRTLIKLDVLNIILGKRGRSINDMPDLGSVPLSYADDEEEVYLYKLPAIIKFIQYQIKVMSENKITSPIRLIDYHNGYKNEIKDKTLWLLTDDLSSEVNTEAKITNVYKYNFRIVSKDVLEKAILNGDDILFVHKVAPYEAKDGKVWKFILSAKDGKAYYIAEHIAGNANEHGLLLKDFREMAK